MRQEPALHHQALTRRLRPDSDIRLSTLVRRGYFGPAIQSGSFSGGERGRKHGSVGELFVRIDPGELADTEFAACVEDDGAT